MPSWNRNIYGARGRASKHSSSKSLPLEALVWEDASVQVRLCNNDPAWLAKRHGAVVCPAVGSSSKALASLMAAAAQP